MDGHNTTSPVQPVSGCSQAIRDRFLERAQRACARLRPRGAYPQSFHPTMRRLRITLGYVNKPALFDELSHRKPQFLAF
jgi:hypothetical protein